MTERWGGGGKGRGRRKKRTEDIASGRALNRLHKDLVPYIFPSKSKKLVNYPESWKI